MGLFDSSLSCLGISIRLVRWNGCKKWITFFLSNVLQIGVPNNESTKQSYRVKPIINLTRNNSSVSLSLSFSRSLATFLTPSSFFHDIANHSIFRKRQQQSYKYFPPISKSAPTPILIYIIFILYYYNYFFPSCFIFYGGQKSFKSPTAVVGLSLHSRLNELWQLPARPPLRLAWVHTLALFGGKKLAPFSVNVRQNSSLIFLCGRSSQIKKSGE